MNAEQRHTFHHVSRSVAASSPSTGYLEDSDGSTETETELWKALVDGFHEIAREILPVTSSGNLKGRQLALVSSLRDPGRLIQGTASPAQYRLALAALLAHIRGIKDTLADHERNVFELLQLAHDPRIARNKSFGEDGSGRRVALHRRRRRKIKASKAPLNVMLSPRMVRLRDR